MVEQSKLLCLLVITVSIILMTYHYYHKQQQIQEEEENNLLENFGLQYYKCQQYGNNKLTENIFKDAGITRSYDKEKWDFYIPCGYNYVENELKGVKFKHQSQKIFGINGCDFIVSKNGLWDIIETKYGRKVAKTLMPETFIIDKSSDIELFKKHYNPNKLYLMKKNIQRKLGIKITKDLNEILGNQDKKFKVIQEYLGDLYLVKKRKINLRVYLLITCFHGKVKAYIHQLGKCIYTNQDYQKHDLEPERHLTSLNVGGDIYQDRPHSFQQLESHLGHQQYKTLMSNIYHNLLLVVKAAKPKLCNLDNIHNNISFQLFGLDYIFTDNMFPYLLEMNKGPDMNPKNKEDVKIKSQVIRDCYTMVGIIPNNRQLNGFNRLKID